MTVFATPQLVPRLGGVHPVRTVAAASVVQRGYQPVPLAVRSSLGGVRDLRVRTEALEHGRQRVLARLVRDARAAGADGVVGVTLRDRESSWAEETLEIRASGTAVRGVGHGDVVLTNLDASELAALAAAGAQVVGLASAALVVAVLAGPKTRERYRYGGATTNFEMPDFTRGVAVVRERLLASLRAQAASVGADGLLALDLHVAPLWPDDRRRTAFSESNVILEGRAVATAVVDRTPAPASPPLALDLRRNA